MSDRVVWTIEDGVADVRLNRPDKLNAVDLAMFDALVDASDALAVEPTVRAVVLSGEGRAFCAGLDFGAFQAMAAGERIEPAGGEGPGRGGGGLGRLGAPLEGRVTNRGQQAVYGWTELPVPVIAAVHGVAFGAGAQLALGADLRVLGPDARLSIMEIRWGLTPDMTGIQRLIELIGLDHAKELTYTGRIVDAAEAVALGLGTRLADDPHATALGLARQIAQQNPHAIRGAKRLLNSARFVDAATGFGNEFREISALIGSPNQVEAVMAQMEKRPARFAD